MNLVARSDLEQVSKLATQETIFELFLWDEGRFSFRAEALQAGPCDQPVGAEMVLLDALRLRDEWVTIQSSLPELSVVLVPAIELEAFRAKRAAIESKSGVSSLNLERLFTLVDGRLSARRAIDLSRLGTFEGARGLVALLRGGALRSEERAAVAEPGEETVHERVSALAWAALAAALLVALGLFATSAPESPGTALPSDGLVDLHDIVSADRIRAALESYRWARGGYPETLDALQGTSELLAAVPLDRYSYLRSPDGYRLWRIRP